MTNEQIKNRIEEISQGKWENDSKDIYHGILYQLNKLRPIQNFNLCINIGDNPDNIISNITLVSFELSTDNIIPNNMSILDFLDYHTDDVIRAKFLGLCTLIIEFDY